MAVIVDSYSEANQISDTSSNVGQSFTGDGSTITKAQFYIKKSGSPTGSVYARIYAHSGTFGTSSVPTGSALAISDAVDSAGLSTSFALVDFTFSGANKIVLTNGTKYVVTFEPSKSSPNYILLGQDTTSPTHGGNKSFDSGGWTADSGTDLCFYVYGESVSPSASVSPSSSVSPSVSPSPSASPSPSPGPEANPSVLKIAKPVVNVLTNSDVEKFIFNSEYGTLKYFDKQALALEINGGASDTACRGSITHGLGYYPYVEVYVSVYIGSATGIYEYCPFFGSGVSVAYSANVKVDTDKIWLYGQFDGVSLNTWHFDFLVFIFKNTLNL